VHEQGKGGEGSRCYRIRVHKPTIRLEN